MDNETPLFEAKDLTKTFRSPLGREVRALQHAALRVFPGETVGILGESGSGKSTLGQIAVGLKKPTAGELFWEGKPLRQPYTAEQRRSIQILFQHPEVSFNPRLLLEKSLAEPFELCGRPYSREELLYHLGRFGLREEHIGRLPGTLSGGELQRAALARILIMEPRLIVLDEPTSMLDVISQAQVIEILRQVQQEQHTAYLFITHNLALCKAFCDRICIIRNGELRECTDIASLRPEDYTAEQP